MIRPGALLGVGVLAGLLLLLGAQAAHAASVSTVVQGDVVRLVSTQDPVASAQMQLGVPVSWDVSVSAARADGVIDVSLDGTATPDAYTVTVRECGEAWSAAGCARGERLLGYGPAGTALTLARQSSAVERWYRVDVELQQEIGGASATLVFRAAGAGTGPGNPAVVLPATGGGILPLTGPAVGAIALGLSIAGVARWRRGRHA